MRNLVTDRRSSMRFAERRDQSGFNLVELLVVICTIAVLAALLLPAMASSALDSGAARCMSNMRQLTAAWQMYANENTGVFAYNEEGGALAGLGVWQRGLFWSICTTTTRITCLTLNTPNLGLMPKPRRCTNAHRIQV